MSAERGWIGEPSPPPRPYIPGEEGKWRLMMGNGQFLTDEKQEALREKVQRIRGCANAHDLMSPTFTNTMRELERRQDQLHGSDASGGEGE